MNHPERGIKLEEQRAKSEAGETIFERQGEKFLYELRGNEGKVEWPG